MRFVLTLPQDHFGGLYNARERGELCGNALAACSVIMRYWADSCRHTHVECASPVSLGPGKPVPRRLIDLGKDANGNGSRSRFAALPPLVRVVETSRLQAMPRYLALSYRWPLVTTAWPILTGTTYAHFTRGLPTSLLPSVFRNVCYIAKALRLRYVWIDMLVSWLCPGLSQGYPPIIYPRYNELNAGVTVYRARRAG